MKLKKEEEFRWEDQHQKAFEDIKNYLANPPIITSPVKGKPLKLYISASKYTIGSMLCQEDENGIERAIYYLSRVLNDAETRYCAIEKLCLCLYFSCTKLKHYIRPFDVIVISHYDIIKHMLIKPILHSRVGKWALALTEYSLQFVPLKAMKGQAVADFLADHSVIEIEENDENYVGLKPWKLYFDGSKHRNGTGIGVLIISPEGSPTKLMFEMITPCSNNEAEYEALLVGLETLKLFRAKNVLIRGDSQLVVKQITREYKCVSENLLKYFVRAVELLREFDEFVIEHIPRCQNYEANELAQLASGYKISKEVLNMLIGIRNKYASKEFEILNITSFFDDDWRKPIAEYLENPNSNASRKLRYKALHYVILGDELYKKSVDGNLLRCLSETEAFIALAEVHEGICGAHQAGEKMKWVLRRQRVYWPSMIKDCHEYARSCEQCQKHENIQHVPASDLHSIIKPWPFRGWALDLISQIFSASSKGHKYIIVAIDYFTKWVEAILLKEVDQRDVIDFIEEHIIF